MVGIVDFCMVYTIVMCFLLAFFPLILKTFVNNAIEKRHHCKLHSQLPFHQLCLLFW